MREIECTPMWFVRNGAIFLRFPYEISCFWVHNFRKRFPYESSCFLLHELLMRFHAFWAATRFVHEISCFLAQMRFHVISL
jgi:hypothetical protein